MSLPCEQQHHDHQHHHHHHHHHHRSARKSPSPRGLFHQQGGKAQFLRRSSCSNRSSRSVPSSPRVVRTGGSGERRHAKAVEVVQPGGPTGTGREPWHCERSADTRSRRSFSSGSFHFRGKYKYKYNSEPFYGRSLSVLQAFSKRSLCLTVTE